MEIGLIGLPLSGKTTVFEAITHTLKDKSSKNTNIGISRVEDPRIDELVALFDPKKI
ncbi:MAG: redox-regulated ATPase YchF, partial [Rickettsiales bacterium]|nr:redox-regulated ATPase YchF [Rickettsiales bacterium]